MTAGVCWGRCYESNRLLADPYRRVEAAGVRGARVPAQAGLLQWVVMKPHVNNRGSTDGDVRSTSGPRQGDVRSTSGPRQGDVRSTSGPRQSDVRSTSG
jgi:hypothetical protein